MKRPDIPCSLSDNHLFTNVFFISRLMGKPFSLRLAYPPLGVFLSDRFYRNRTILFVKYLATNSYVPFITVCLNKFLDNKTEGDDIDASNDIDPGASNYDECANYGYDVGNRPILYHPSFELAKAMSPCIIWIPTFMILM
ncbi:hypothetical protein HID58_090145 [Brassica napus]|uniref:Uncharacterized protein n=1 Tax=Brassica napus TaxID=3708 RepID=A0ABQ7XE15_BRANA|nr:hypothetical protein HID58_090145 [Brassica napus]